MTSCASGWPGWTGRSWSSTRWIGWRPTRETRVASDLALVVRRVRRREVPVLATAAVEGEAGIAPLRGWLAEAAEAKAIVAARLTAAARAALAPSSPPRRASATQPRPLVAEAAQRRAIEDATTEVLRVIDLPGLERAGGGRHASARPAARHRADRAADVRDLQGIGARARRRPIPRATCAAGAPAAG